jgi:VWFA-related protein
VVDVVVRDGKGDPVTDLRKDDFELLEDGVRQDITSFEHVDRRAAQPEVAQQPSLAKTTSVGEAPPVVLVAFEELGEESRAAAYEATLALIDDVSRMRGLMAVYVIDRALHVTSPLTTDAGRLRRGARDAAMRPGCPVTHQGDVPGAAAGSACADMLPGRHRTIAALDALGALTDSLQPVPGRKTVLLFSEGIPLEVESDLPERFAKLTASANRSNVSFYTVDAAGLRAQNPSAAARRLLRTYTAEDRHSFTASSVGPDAVFGEPYVALSRLAGETGGTFTDNTNDLGRASQRLLEDLQLHYLLGYSPTNARLDGSFRRLSVAVRGRPDLAIQARYGYAATPVAATVPPHAVAPLVIVEQQIGRRDFEVEASADAAPDGLVRVRAEVPNSALRYSTQASDGRFAGELVVLARTAGRDNQTLSLASELFLIGGPLADLPGVKGQATSFVTELRTTPEAQWVDVIAYDPRADRASVRRLTIASESKR